jgi:hypothetical protein
MQVRGLWNPSFPRKRSAPRVDRDDRREELLLEDDRAWLRLMEILEPLSPEVIEAPGFTEDWTVKDFMAHMGCWMAECAHVLERIRLGTWERAKIDVDAMNEFFYQACKDLDLVAVKSGFWSSRVRMLQEWYLLPEVTPDADEWFRESGPEHIADHLPDLQRFVRDRS